MDPVNPTSNTAGGGGGDGDGGNGEPGTIDHRSSPTPPPSDRQSDASQTDPPTDPPTVPQTDPQTDPQTAPQTAPQTVPSSSPDLQREKLRVAAIISALCAAIFIAALDITIIATAAPTISAEFAAASGYQWIAAAFNLPNTATTPSWGKVSDIWGRKPILLAAIVIFLGGSLCCALAQNFATFVGGRAVQGFGAAGLTTLVNICISDLFSLRDRSFYYGLTMFVWAFASGIGPVLGGVFTQKASWRWCFWLNVPISGIVFILLFFFLHLENPKTPVIAGLLAVDWIGSILIIGGTLMILFGLDFGGVTFPWDSATVICLLVFGAVVGVIFVVNEAKLAKYPVIPTRIFHGLSNIASMALCFCHGYVFLGIGFYMPVYFQAVLGAGPLLSGVYLLPFILPITVAGIVTGIYIQKSGKYKPPIYIGLALMTLGTGLLIKLSINHVWSEIILFQLIAGFGCGMVFEPPLLAVQAVMPHHDSGTVVATFSFVRSLSTAISVVVGAVVFQNRMLEEASRLLPILGSDGISLISGGEALAHVDLIQQLPPAERLAVHQALLESLKDVWIMYTAFSGVACISGFFIKTHELTKEHNPAAVGLTSEKEESHGEELRSPEETGTDNVREE